MTLYSYEHSRLSQAPAGLLAARWPLAHIRMAELRDARRVLSILNLCSAASEARLGLYQASSKARPFDIAAGEHAATTHVSAQ